MIFPGPQNDTIPSLKINFISLILAFTTYYQTLITLSLQKFDFDFLR